MKKREDAILEASIAAAAEIVGAYLMRGNEVDAEFNTGGDMDDDVIEAVRAAARFLKDEIFPSASEKDCAGE